MPVILTSCTVRFLPIDGPWKPVCKERRQESEERTQSDFYRLKALWNLLRFLFVQETTLPSAEGRNALLSASASAAGWVSSTKTSGYSESWFCHWCLHRGWRLSTGTSRSTRLCTPASPFDALWKQIAPCLPTLEVGQNPCLHFREERGNWIMEIICLESQEWVVGTVSNRLQVLQLLKQIIMWSIIPPGYGAQSGRCFPSQPLQEFERENEGLTVHAVWQRRDWNWSRLFICPNINGERAASSSSQE